MWRPLAIAVLAACGNALFVYGQRVAGPSSNPFLFMAGCISSAALLFLLAAVSWQSPDNMAFASVNAGYMMLGGIGLFITFLGFYLLYSGYGASQYALYAVASILTTSLGVGVLIFREEINRFQIAAILLAIVTIVLWTYGRSVGPG
jgi:drug/metabolite transporter (DMT)-like permease